MDRRLNTTKRVSLGEVPFTWYKAATEVARLAEIERVRIFWQNRELTGERLAFEAEGRVYAYAIDGEERDCIILLSDTYPNRRQTLRCIVADQIILIERVK